MTRQDKKKSIFFQYKFLNVLSPSWIPLSNSFLMQGFCSWCSNMSVSTLFPPMISSSRLSSDLCICCSLSIYLFTKYNSGFFLAVASYAGSRGRHGPRPSDSGLQWVRGVLVLVTELLVGAPGDVLQVVNADSVHLGYWKSNWIESRKKLWLKKSFEK